MLIRVISHFSRANPHGIDEMIRIDGLQDDLLFRKKDGKTYLNHPWEPDIDVNIPKSIREHCTPMDITIDLPPERNEATGVWQRPSDTFRILGIKINLDTMPGTQMWKQVERILDRGTSRDQKIPVPRPIAPNQKEAFNLEAQDIPIVVLKPEIMVQPTPTITVVASVPEVKFEQEVKVEKKVKEVFTCPACDKKFKAQRGLWMHGRKKGHVVDVPEKEAVTA